MNTESEEKRMERINNQVHILMIDEMMMNPSLFNYDARLVAEEQIRQRLLSEERAMDLRILKKKQDDELERLEKIYQENLLRKQSIVVEDVVEEKETEKFFFF